MIAVVLALLLDGSDCCGLMGRWGSLGVTVMMIGLVALVVWAITGSGTAPTRALTALEILASRYADGEISYEEYVERRSVLNA